MGGDGAASGTEQRAVRSFISERSDRRMPGHELTPEQEGSWWKLTTAHIQVVLFAVTALINPHSFGGFKQ